MAPARQLSVVDLIVAALASFQEVEFFQVVQLGRIHSVREHPDQRDRHGHGNHENHAKT